MNKYYRPDIDGLRAFAVISVIFFHLDYGFASGGFVGVDVFFVISGFLITGIIKKEVENSGGFNYTNFYIRRIRRIFPALFVTVLISAVIAMLLFSPPHLERVGGSIIHALSSFSNIYFWTEAGYFDSAADVKPLLHTWSLGIEEQFYFLWPFFFVAIIKTKNKALLILALGGMISISLFLNYLFLDGHVEAISNFSTYAAELISDGQATIFYLLPFRLYEFAIGGLLVYAQNYSVKSRVANEIILLVGMALVCYSVFMFTEQTPFPSYNALVPCVGAGLIIYSNNGSAYLGRLLANRVAVGIGLISYSLYLVHWPVIVFWKYYTFENITVTQSIAIIIISILMAVLMYRYVEQPFRLKRGADNKDNSAAGAGVAALFVGSFLVVIAANIWVNNGWEWRVDSRVSPELVPSKVKMTRPKVLTEEMKWANARIIGNKNDVAAKVLVIGDSHAGHLKGAAEYLSEKYNLSFTFITYLGCPPIFGTYKVYGAPRAIKKESIKQQQCRKQTSIWEEYVRANQFDYVILGSRWNLLFEPRKYYDTEQRRDLLIDKSSRKFTVDDSRKVFSVFLDYTVKTIHASGAKAIIVGQVPLEGKDLEGCDNVPRFLVSESNILKRCRHVPKEFVLKRSEFSNKTIRRVAAVNNAISIIPTDYFCSENSEFCRTMYDGTRLKDDANHINSYGSVFLAKKWEESKEFPFKSAYQVQ